MAVEASPQSARRASANNAGVVDSVDKALCILLAFSYEKPEWGVSELARELGLNKSRVFRALNALQRRGVVEQNPRTGKYELGLRLFELGSVVASRMDLRIRSEELLKELSLKARGTVLLIRMQGDYLVVLDAVGSPDALSITVKPGERVPLFYGAAGKVLTSYLDDPEVDRLLELHQLRAFTSHSITDPAALKSQLLEVRRQGFAFSDEEVFLGARALAAPVRDSSGQVIAALSIWLPTVNLPQERLPEVTSMVQDYAERISARLGYRAANTPLVDR